MSMIQASAMTWIVVFSCLWAFNFVIVTCRDSQKPNIVMILADDYGWHDVGYHGSEIETPVLDKLASEGIKLERYYVQPICSPSRSQLMSGRYQIHTGLQHGVIHPAQPNGLPLELPTVADKLREAGYSTHMVGKWHLGFYRKEYTPLYRGFDTFYGYLTGEEDYFKHRRCWEYKDMGNQCGMDLRDMEEPANATGEYSAHLFAQKSSEIFANHNKSKPLFLYLPFQSVHGPTEAPASYIQKYDWIKDVTRRTFAGMVSAMDEAIGNITDSLKKHGLWDNTILVFSTDNGGPPVTGANNWPLRGQKATLWEGGVRGVAFVNGQVGDRAGATSQELIHITDWYPTFLHLAGVSTNDTKLDGFNVWDTISQNTPSPRGEILHNIDPIYPKRGENLYPDLYDVRVRSSLRNGHWKIITGDPGIDTWNPKPNDTRLVFEPKSADTKKNLWLFNVTADPSERSDLSEEYPEIVRLLLERLAFYNSTAVPCRYPDDDPNSMPSKLDGYWGPWETDSGKTLHDVENQEMPSVLKYIPSHLKWP